MGIKIGSSDISKVYHGSTEITKVYHGSTLVYDGSGGGGGLPNGVNVVAYASDRYTCSSNGQSTTVSNTIPDDVESGDMIVATLFARSSVTAPTGYTLAKSQANPNTTTGQFSAIYYKTASGSEGGTSLTFTQSTSQRMGLAITILRSSTGGVTLDTTGSNTGDGSFTTYPNLTAASNGSVAIYTGGVTSHSTVALNLTTNFNIAKSYEQTTRGSDVGLYFEPGCAFSEGKVRMVSGYKYINSGSTGTSDISDLYKIGSSVRLAQCLAIFKPSSTVSAPTFPSYSIFHGDGNTYGTVTDSNWTTKSGNIFDSNYLTGYYYKSPSTSSQDSDIASPPTLTFQLYGGKTLTAVRVYNYITSFTEYGGYYTMNDSPYKFQIEASTNGTTYTTLDTPTFDFALPKKTYEDTTVVSKDGTFRKPLENYIQIPIDNSTSYSYYRVKFLRGQDFNVDKDGTTYNGFYIAGVSLLEDSGGGY